MKIELRKHFNSSRIPAAASAQIAQMPAAAYSFKADIVVAGECDPKLGWLMDYAEISRHSPEKPTTAI